MLIKRTAFTTVLFFLFLLSTCLAGSRSKAMVSIGILGHTGHGKRDLTKAVLQALSMSDPGLAIAVTDSSKAAKQRALGVWIDFSIATYETNRRQYQLITPKSHADYVKGMITGEIELDGAILVISAVEGPMPQTREQIQLARQAGVPGVVVFLNDCDKVEDEELIELVELETRELLDKYEFPGDDIPVIRGDATTALSADKKNSPFLQPIYDLLKAMDMYIPEPGVFSREFLMPIEDVFNIKGRGTMVTGRVESGHVKVGDKIQLYDFSGNQTDVHVKSIEMFRRTLKSAGAGQNISISIGYSIDINPERGQVLASADNIVPFNLFRAEVYVLTKSEGGRRTPFFSGYRPQFYLRTVDIPGVIHLPEGVEMVMPGDFVSISVELEKFIVLEQGLRFAIREGRRTIGVGLVTEILD